MKKPLYIDKKESELLSEIISSFEDAKDEEGFKDSISKSDLEEMNEKIKFLKKLF